jgi:hypothetical protein
MTDNKHPITPPPELVEQWECEYHHMTYGPDLSIFISEKAARWGADQELEACCEWLRSSLPGYDKHYADYLHTARRPKPPSLKEQALEIVRGTPVNSAGLYSYEHVKIIRRALEQLDD